MSEVTLRGYQEEQIKFLRMNNGLTKGLQSPTGTGKSIVFLQYVKECIEQNKYKTIVLTTGFNELVFQMADDCKLFDLHPKVIIGAGHLIPNCVPKYNAFPDFKFSNVPVNACSSCSIESVKRKQNANICSKKCILDYLRNGKPKFIITNHSYFLVMKDIINADLVIVDEAQTFGDFYMSYNTVSLNQEEKDILMEYCNSVITPTSQILKMSLTKGLGINENLLQNVSTELKSYLQNSDYEVNSFIRKLQDIFAKRSFENYLEENNGEFIKTHFFSKYDLDSETKKPEIIITSATLDQYTLKMFGCTNKNQIYIQKEDRNRYSGSYFLSDYSDYRDGFEKTYTKILNEYKSDSGLILCTSNESVRWTIEFLDSQLTRENSQIKVKVFTKASEFKQYKEGKKVLVGSKKFFQGVNIPELDYVIMDKLPFSPYDDKFQAYSYYIEKTMREKAWSGYSLPLMFNTLLQGMGRLWRKNDIENNIYDQGLFAIFDARLEKKFNYVESRVVELKPGISLVKLVKGEPYVEEVKEEPKNKKRKIVAEELTEEDFEEIMAEYEKKHSGE